MSRSILAPPPAWVNKRWPGATARMAKVARLLLETDLTYAQIGARCGVSRQRVGQVMRELRKR